MSRFVYEPDEKLLHGHVVVISTANDLLRHLGNAKVNWPLVVAGLKRKGLIAE